MPSECESCHFFKGTFPPDFAHLSKCSGKDEMASYRNAISYPLRKTSAETYAKTGCLLPCDFYEYNLEVSRTAEADKERRGTMFVAFSFLDYRSPVYK